MNRLILTTVLALSTSIATTACTVFSPAQFPETATTTTTTTPSTPSTTSTASTTTPSTTTSTTAATTTAPVTAANDGLQLALTIHVERRDTEVSDRAEFEGHVATLEQLADLAVEYDVILNFELSTVFVQAVDRWGSTFIEDMTALGHNISQHSGDESTSGLTGDERVAELMRQREAIEAHGVTVNYLSGACSADDDWVESAIAAGFSAATGNVEYCLRSLDDATLPDGMEWIDDCHSQSICHDPLHVGTERVMHPWTTSSSATWLVDDPEGDLVIFTTDEADGFVAMSQTGDADLNLSLEQWTAMLDAYVAAAVPGQLNVVNMVLSVGPEPDWALVQSMFAAAQARQDAGLLTWANLTDVVEQAVAEAPTQPADPPVIYTDITPDLGRPVGATLPARP
ncbi:MAG: hypothetical protein RLZZ623_309 [Actinomycetota bacterium]